MNTVYSNRALGILSKFIQEQHHINHWVIPANICFSVPFLLISLNRKLSFYDFSFNAESLETSLKNNRNENKGILLVNHYGIPWDENTISSIRGHSSLVLDACLSPPDFQASANKNIDLSLYSTGKGKVVDLGYGAFGHLKTCLKTDKVTSHLNSYKKERYKQLEMYWKQVVQGLPFNANKLIKQNWVDPGSERITDSEAYRKLVNSYLKSVMKKKEEINKIYNELINPEFLLHPGGNLWRYNIVVNDPDLLLKELFSNGLFASRHYSNASRLMGYQTNLPNADLISHHVVNLMNSENITADFAVRCSETVNYLIKTGKIKPQKIMFV